MRSRFHHRVGRRAMIFGVRNRRELKGPGEPVPSDTGEDLAGVSVAVDARAIARPGIGFHTYLTGAVKCLLELRAEVCLLTNFSSRPYEGLFNQAEWLSFGNRHDLIWDQFDLPRLLRRRRFDLYWAPANNGVPLLAPRGTWTISTTHDLVPLRLPRMYLYPKPLFALPYVVWTLSTMARSRTLLTVSQSSADDIRHLFGRRATVIPSVFGGLSREARPELLPPELASRTFAVYNGGLDPRKNVPALLEALAIASRDWPELTLVLMGSGYDVFDAVLARLRISERVVRTGFVPDEIRSAIIAGAVVLAYPSLYEGFGLPLLEAYALGTPVLTAANSSLREVAGDAAVFVDPKRPESIAEGLLSFRDAKLRERLRAAGNRRLAIFDPDLARERLAGALVDVAERQARRMRSKRR